MERVKSRTTSRIQLERWSMALVKGEPFGQAPVVTPGQSLAPTTADLSSATTAPPPGGPATAPPATDGASPSPASVSLEIWAPVPGQMSGAEMTIHVDGAEVGALSNLGNNRRLALTGVSPGAHKLALHIAKVYFMDPVKGPSLAGGPFRCDTLFEAKADSAPLRLNVANGFNGLVCAAQ